MGHIYKNKKAYVYLLISILSIGIGLRLYKLGNGSLWFDESLPLISTGDALKILLSGKFYYPIAYASLVHYYWTIVGNSEFMLRLSSAIFGAASIIALYFLAKLLFNKKAGLFSAFILSISPFHIYYSQELRMYSLISLLSLVSAYCLIKSIRVNKNIYWSGYALFNIINIYVHPMAIFILISEMLFFLLYIGKYRHLITRWAVSHLVISIFLIPWIVSMFSGLRLVIARDNWFFESTLSWIPTINAKNLFYTFKNFSAGYNAAKEIYLIAMALFFILFCIGIAKSSRRKEGLALSLLCLFIPIFSAALISKFRPCYLDRYFIPSSLFYCLIIGNGLSELKKRYAFTAVACIAFLSICALKNFYADYLPGTFIEHIGVQAKNDDRGAAKYVAENFKKEDAIFHTCRNTVPSFMYYFDRLHKGGGKPKKNMVLKFHEDSDKLSTSEYATDELHRFIDKQEEVNLNQQDRIWIIYSGWDFNIAMQPESPESKVIRWMDKRYIIKDSQFFSGIKLYLYIK